MHNQRFITMSIVAGALALPAVAHASSENVVHVYSVTNGNVVSETDEVDLSDAHPAGWSFMRPYVAGGSHFVFALKRQTGEAQIFNATAGDMGLPVAGVYDLGTDWTSAAIYYIGAAPYLVLHRSRDGVVWRYALTNTGALGAKTTFASIAAWRDKSDFVPYFYNNALRFAASDRWTGRAAFHDGSGVAIASATWTRGWTSADYFDSGLAGTWRVMYKPLETPGDEIGRIVVQKVGSDGATNPTLSDSTVLGWTHVRFVRTPPPGGSTRIFLYDATTGNWALRSFSTVTGLGAVVASGDVGSGTNLAPNMVDLAVYASGSTAYIYGVQEDENRVLSAAELDTLSGGPDGPDAGANDYGSPTSVYQAYRSSYGGDAPGGWELAFMQGGRLVLRTDGGTSNYGEGIAMDGTRHRWNFGSGAKAFTGITAVKLAERGEIDLDAPLEVYLDPEAYPTIHADNRTITARDLIGYRSGWEDRTLDCANDCGTNWSCPEELALPRDCPSCAMVDGYLQCNVAYANSNFAVMRNVVEWTMGRQVPEDDVADDLFVPSEYVAYMKWLWWDRAGIGEARCTPDPVTHADTRAEAEQLYYSALTCNQVGPDYGAAECTSLAGLTLPWTEAIYMQGEPGNGAACGQGGLQATAENVARMLASIRYERVLSPDGTAYIVQANPNGGDRAGFYGSTLDTTANPDTYFVGKNGGNAGIAESLMHRWSLGVDSALVTNDTYADGDEDFNVSTSAILKNAWLERTIP